LPPCRLPRRRILFPYTTLFRSEWQRRQEEKTALDKAIKQLKEVRPDLLQLSQAQQWHRQQGSLQKDLEGVAKQLKQKKEEHSREDRKSTRLNSSHVKISYAVFC